MKYDFLPDFSLILLANKSEHMVKIDKVITMGFAKTL